jgi:hypothetical protein
MRVTNAVICISCMLMSATTFARDVEFPSTNSEFIQSDRSNTEDFPPAFIESEWTTPAIEGHIENTQQALSYSFEDFQRIRQERSSIDRKEIFHGSWSPPKRSDPRSGFELPSPPCIPPLDRDWLTKAVWPRTRCYLEGNGNNAIFGTVAVYR